ncbi:MAG: alpha-1,2-fucosyltransferase [Propionibacteriaceae bacterium]
MKNLIRQAKTSVLEVVRQGPREVVWTPPWMGFGNVAYLWLWAHIRNTEGADARVLDAPGMASWMTAFPRLGPELGITRDAVAFRDKRRSAVSHNYGRFGTDFTSSQLAEFLQRYYVESPAFETAAKTERDPQQLTINVRRGDYYAVQHRAQFAMDVVAYLEQAVQESTAAQGRPSRIHVISDGLDWCKVRLGWLADHADSLTFADPTDGPLRNLTDVAFSHRLILANSTFSYWGGYLNGVLRPDSKASVWAPRFFCRTDEGRSAWQLDPAWSVVEDIPGGWDS